MQITGKFSQIQFVSAWQQVNIYFLFALLGTTGMKFSYSDKPKQRYINRNTECQILIISYFFDAGVSGIQYWAYAGHMQAEKDYTPSSLHYYCCLWVHGSTSPISSCVYISATAAPELVCVFHFWLGHLDTSVWICNTFQNCTLHTAERQKKRSLLLKHLFKFPQVGCISPLSGCWNILMQNSVICLSHQVHTELNLNDT